MLAAVDRYYVVADGRRKRARLHNGSCVYCLNGTYSDPSRWSPGFTSLAAARLYLREEYQTFIDTGEFPLCLRHRDASQHK